MLGDLEIGFNTLLEATESDFQCNLVTKNPFKDMVYNTKQAEAAIIFDVCALAEIGNTKNNLIGVSDLSCFVLVFVFEIGNIVIVITVWSDHGQRSYLLVKKVSSICHTLATTSCGSKMVLRFLFQMDYTYN